MRHMPEDGRGMIADTGLSAPIWAMAALTVLFTVKHYAADFVLQTSWIAHGKDARIGWVAPLATHVAIHGALALAIALAVQPRLWWLALVDMAVHFVVDRGKTLIGRWGAWNVQNARYWWLFGFDQLLHQVTNVALAAALLAL